MGRIATAMDDTNRLVFAVCRVVRVLRDGRADRSCDPKHIRPSAVWTDPFLVPRPRWTVDGVVHVNEASAVRTAERQGDDVRRHSGQI